MFFGMDGFLFFFSSAGMKGPGCKKEWIELSMARVLSAFCPRWRGEDGRNDVKDRISKTKYFTFYIHERGPQGRIAIRWYWRRRPLGQDKVVPHSQLILMRIRWVHDATRNGDETGLEEGHKGHVCPFSLPMLILFFEQRVFVTCFVQNIYIHYHQYLRFIVHDMCQIIQLWTRCSVES